MHAARAGAFDVLSLAERTGERIPWLSARAAALRACERASVWPAPAPPQWVTAREGLLEAAAVVAEAAAGGAEAEPSAGDPQAARRRLRAIAAALDVADERLTGMEALTRRGFRPDAGETSTGG